MRNSFRWVYFILGLLLIVLSFYLIHQVHKEKKTYTDYQDHYRKLIRYFEHKYDFHLRFHNFMEFAEKFSSLPGALFEMKGKNIKYAIRKFISEADSILAYHEQWNHMLHSPADIFFQIKNNNISEMVILFETPSISELSVIPVKSLQHVKISDPPFEFNILTNVKEVSPKTETVQNYSYLSHRELKQNYLMVKGDIQCLFEAVGLKLPFKVANNDKKNLTVFPEFHQNRIFIQINAPCRVESNDFNYLLSSDTIFNHHLKLHSIDSINAIAGFSVLNSLEKNLHSLKHKLRINKNSEIIAGKIKDKQSLIQTIQYLSKLKQKDDIHYAYLPKIYLKHYHSDHHHTLFIFDDTYFAIFDSLPPNEIQPAMPQEIRKTIETADKEFNEIVEVAGKSETECYENNTDTLQSKFIRKIKFWTTKENITFLEYNIHKSSHSQPDWITLCDDTLLAGPFHFINHHNHNDEVLVQDKRKYIYLIGTDGAIVKKLSSSGLIGNELYIVDMFKNKRYQMLFKSGNQIHLIDRNGNYINAYPFTIHSKITGPLNVIRYKNSDEYRMWFACKDRKIYSYNLFAMRPEKFEPYRTENLVRLPVKYLSFYQSDYLITIDEEGHIHSFGRKGDPRIGLKNKCLKNIEKYGLSEKNNLSHSFLFYLDRNEKSLHKIFLDDRKEIIKLNDIRDYITAYDLTDGRSPHLAILSNKEYFIYDENAILKFRGELPFQATKCKAFQHEENIFVLFNDFKTNQMVLVVNGKILIQGKLQYGTVFYSEKENQYFFIGINGKQLLGYRLSIFENAT